MRVLTVSAHPDDETLGAGGTLLKHRANGDDLFWIITTAAYEDAWPKEHIAESAKQVEDVNKAYGFQDMFKLDLPSTKLDTLPKRDMVEKLMKIIDVVRPDRVYTVGDTDVHTDHYCTFEAMMLALKPFREAFDVKSIYAYEVASSTEAAFGFRPHTFVPNVYSEITEYLEQKLDLMDMFQNQLQGEFLPRSRNSLRALARYRGSAIGVEYAEAFRLIREVF